jgi:hypothetical protein
MRLTIAVGILSAQSSILPVASEKKIRSSDDSSRERFSLQNALSAIGSTSFRGDGRGLLNRSGAGGIHKENKTPLTQSSTRSSSRALEDGKIVECNPAAIAEARNAVADVGILGCGYDEVCVANADSSMGGFCYETYGIAKVCDPLSNAFDPACDCSAFDVQTKTGTISCPYDNKNMGASFYGCYDVSTQTSPTFTLKDNMYIARGFCTEFLVVGDEDATNTTQLCTTLDTVYGSPFNFNGSSCELQIDGQTCTSCTFTMDFSEWPVTSEILENMADCSNVVDGLMIEVYDFANLPIIQACYKPINGTFCDFCADNTYIDSLDKKEISLDGFGSDFTCGRLDGANNANQISSDKCPEATALAQAECCIARRSETSVPGSPAPSKTALSLVSAGIFLTSTSFMLAMN